MIKGQLTLSKGFVDPVNCSRSIFWIFNVIKLRIMSFRTEQNVVERREKSSRSLLA
jgi:hypothetical protein